MTHNRTFMAISIVAMIGCGNMDSDSVQVTAPQASVPTAAPSTSELKRSKPMVQDDTKPWRSDPVLAGRFHPEYPDDLQVIVHDGGPRFTDKPAEAVWVTVTGKHERAYRGKILNQPHGLKSVKQGDEIFFLAVEGVEHPFYVSERLLAERDDWVIRPCDQCGFAELFDAPSDLVRKVFPHAGNNPNEKMEAFTSFCPMCGGVQVIHKPGFNGE